MASEPISAMTQFTPAGRMLLPVVDPAAGPGLKNGSVLVSALIAMAAASIVQRLPLPAAVAGVITLPFAANGDVCYEGVPGANATITLSGGSTETYQRVILAIAQGPSGGITVTLPSSSSSPAVAWPGGTPPAIGTAANQRTVVVFATTGTENLYDGS